MMICAAVLMKKNEVKILENVDEKMIEKLKKQKDDMDIILCEDTIDWDYGY